MPTTPVTVKSVTIDDVQRISATECFYDADQDGIQDTGEMILTQSELEILTQGKASGTMSLQKLIESISEGRDFADLSNSAKVEAAIKAIQKKLDNVDKQLKAIDAKIVEAKAETDPSKKTDVSKLEAYKLQLQSEKAEILAKLKVNQAKINSNTNAAKTYKAILAKHAKTPAKLPPKAAKGPGTNPPAGGKQGQVGAGGARFAWTGGPKYGGDVGGFNMDAYRNSIYMDQAILEGWDSVNKNQNQQRKMMMLFFYFAKMAMSGDLGAMYRFMQFITAIISKDKALQQVDMASKLIELQELNRVATQRLVDFDIDPDDPRSQTDFTKLMESTRAETASIATSQKLIASMMEEFAQVVETLTGVTKTALDANGRVERMLARA
jgi:hypothetical protein